MYQHVHRRRAHEALGTALGTGWWKGGADVLAPKKSGKISSGRPQPALSTGGTASCRRGFSCVVLTDPGEERFEFRVACK